MVQLPRKGGAMAATTNEKKKGENRMQWWVALIAALIMAGGLGGLFYLIIRQQAALDAKSIRFLAILFVLPLLIILGLFNVLGRETIGTVIGVVVGYVLSGSIRE